MSGIVRAGVAGFFSALVVAGSASAGIINIQGSVANSNEQTGATLTGTIDYQHIGGNNGTVTIYLENSSPPVVGGFLTGFLFNFGTTDGSASASLASTTNANFLNTGASSGNPFGNFMAGASLGANWEGGGSPAGGIPIGGNATFVFNVSASDAATLTSASFLEGPNTWNFVARFRGLTGGGSDKVPVVPTPGSMALAALGLALAARRRSR